MKIFEILHGENDKIYGTLKFYQNQFCFSVVIKRGIAVETWYYQQIFIVTRCGSIISDYLDCF